MRTRALPLLPLLATLSGLAAFAQGTPPQPPSGAFQPPATKVPAAAAVAPQPAAEAAAPAALPLEPWRFNARERTARGLTAWRDGQPAAAVAALDTAARLKPGDALAAYNSGTAHLAAGLGDSAAILERALESAPADLATDGRYNLGNARLAAQDAAGAIEAFRETLRRAPGHAGARRNLELANLLLEQQKQQQQKQQPSGDPSEKDQNQDENAGEGDGNQPPRESGDPSGSPSGDDEADPSSRGEPGERPLPQFRDQEDMSAEQAAAILDAVDNLEREKRRDEARKRARAKSTVEKDW